MMYDPTNPNEHGPTLWTLAASIASLDRRLTRIEAGVGVLAATMTAILALLASGAVSFGGR